MRKLIFTLCCVLGVLFVKGQTSVVISSGTNVVNTGTAYNISTGTAGTFTNNGTYTDTTSPGSFNMTGPFTVSGSGTTLVYNLNFFTSGSSSLTSQISVYNTATIGAGTTVDAGAGNLALRTDILPHYATANLVINGVLTGTVTGTQTYATATSGCAPSYASTLSCNVSGAVTLYQWESSPNNSTWTPVSGATNATYSATVSAAIYYHVIIRTSNSLFTNTTNAILLNMTPVPAAIGGTMSVCMGGTTTLTDAVTGGTWASGNTGIANIGSSSGIVSPVSSGTVTMTYSTGCAPDVTAVVTVNALPVATFSVTPNPVCMGTAALFSSSIPFCSGTGLAFSGGTGVATAAGVVSTATSNVTMEAWVKWKGTGGALQMIETNGNTGLNGYSMYADNGTMKVVVGLVTILSSGYTLTPGTWTHVATVCDASHAWTMYINGSPIALGSATPNVPSNTPGSFYVGNDPNYGSQVFQGLIDEVKFWTVARTASQITSDMNACSAAPQAGLVGYWPFNEGSGTTTADASGNGNNLTITSPVWIPTSPATYSWAFGDGSTSTANNVNHTYTTAATYTPTLSVTSSGCTAALTGSVTVNTTPTVITGTMNVCVGLTTTLNSTPGGGTWTAQNANATVGSGSGVVTGATAGTDNITYTYTGGCNAVAQVTVNNLPGTITGTMNVCVGQTTTLNSTPSGGVWTSNNANATVNSTSGVVTGVTTGTSIISYAFGPACISTATVTINPNPVITASGAASICNTTSTTIGASGAGVGGTYSWSPSASLSAATGASVTASPSVTTTYTVTGVNTSGCFNTATVTVTVFPAPAAITGNRILSTAITTTLANTTAGGTWSSVSTGVATINSSGVVTGVTVGTSLISYYFGGTCLATATVTVNAPTSGLSFDGTDDVVNIASNATLNISSNITIETWMYATKNTGVQNVVCKSSSGSNNGYIFPRTDNGWVNLVSYLNFGSWFVVTAPYPGLNQWHHTAMTYDGATVKIYIDGLLAASAAHTGSISTNGNPVALGNQTGYSEFFGGKVDETRIWNIARTQSQIQADMNCDVPQQVGLVANYRYNEGAAGGTNTAQINTIDYSGNNNCGALTNFALTGTSSNYVTGAVGSCNASAVILPASTNTGTPVVCVGQNTTLSNSVAGGAWTSSNNLIATAGTSGIVTGVSGGNINISYTLNCGITVTPVTVNALPTVGVSPSVAICLNNSTTLTASGATTYSWSPAAGLSATTGASVTATPTVTTTYTITGTNSLGCSNTAAVTVTVNPLPPTAVSPNVAICLLQSTTLTASGAVTYSWSPATALSATTGASVTATPTVTTTYTVTGTNSLGCSKTAMVTVTVNPLPPTSVSSSVAICLLQNTTLTASGAATYSWSPATALSATTGASVVANPTVTTTYTVTGSTTFGCTRTAVVTVTVNPLPVVVISPVGTAICIGQTTGALTASGAVTYSWSPATSLSATTGATVTSSTTSTRTYIVTGTSALSCSSTANITVTVNPLPTVTASSTEVTIVCGGTPITITGVGATTYSWTPNTGLSASTGASVVATPAATTTYTVTGTNALGCSNTARVTVTINPSPALTGTGGAYCTGGFTSISAAGGTTYSWSPSTGLTATTGSLIIANPVGTTTYSVSTTNGFGCTSTVAVVVTVNPYPVVTTSGDVTICTGSSTTMTASGATTYNWYPSTGLSTVTGSSTVASPTVTSTYGVFGTTNGCATGANITVSVNPVPGPLTVSPGVAICSGTSTMLTVSGALTYSWSPSTGLSATTGSAIFASPTVTTTYTVSGTNSFNCSTPATITVTVNTLPTISAGPGMAICTGSSALLTATGATTYTWSPSTGLSATTGTSVTATPTVTTTYAITGTAGVGCSNTGFVTVTVNTIPAISAGSGVAICNGLSTVLTASGGTTYTWIPSAGLSATTGASVTASPTSTTTYTVTGTGSCSGTAFVTVTVNATPTISTASSYGFICNGNSIAVTASGASTYSWSPSASLSASTGATVTANPIAQTTYTITGTSALGCVNSTAVTVYVNSTPSVVSTSGNAVCIGAASSSVSATPSGTSFINWYSLATGGTLLGTGNVLSVLTPTVTADYYASAQNTLVTNTLTTTFAAGNFQNGIMFDIVAVNPISINSIDINALAGTSTFVIYARNGTMIGNDLSSAGWDLIATLPGIVGTGGSTNLPLPAQLGLAPGTYGLYITSTTNSVNYTNGSLVGAIYASNSDLQIKQGYGKQYLFSSTFQPRIPNVKFNYSTNLSCPSTPRSVATLTVNPLPTVSAGTGVAICPSGSTGLTATGAATYSWAPSGSLSAATGATVTASPAITTTYTITGTSATGCINTGFVTVTVNTLPTISAGSNVTICNGSNTTLTASGGSTYSWTPSASLSAATGVSVTASPSVTTIYTVTGTSGAGCSNTASVQVSVNPLPGITVSPSTSICTGLNTVLTASGATTYSWSPSAGLTATTGASVTASPTVTTVYTVSGTGSGCSSPATVTVTVNPLPTIGAGSVAAICSGNSTGLTATGGISYTWAPGASLSATTGASVTASPASTTTYTITGTNSNGCVNTGFVTVTVNPLPGTITATGATSFSYGGSIQSYTVPAGVTSLNISASGAQGGNVTSIAASGGLGANLSGAFSVISGHVLNILVGQQPATSIYNGGGGGGSFVWDVTAGNLLLIAAGGGGGASSTFSGGFCNCAYLGVDASITNNGTNGSGGLAGAGTVGNGASAVVGSYASIYGGGGTGWLTAGAGGNGGPCPPYAGGGSTPLSGGAGGNFGSAGGLNGNGGFGGGGGGQGYCGLLGGAGGGGGYSGGAAGGQSNTTTYFPYGGGGGGSYNSGSGQVNAVSQTGNGVVTISFSLPQSICAGATTTLSTTSSGGSWSSSNTNATVGSSTGIVTGVTNGTSTITYTLPTGCYTTTTVTINSLPTITASGGSFCAGLGPVAITASGASTYTWASATGLSATTGASVNANPASSATYTVTGTNALGCSSTATAGVTVNPTPTISAGSSVAICTGSSTTLTATGGSTYSWTPATGLSAATGATVTASPTVTTTYSITGTNSFGCSNTVTKTVSVNPLAAAITGNTTLSTSITTTLADATVGGTWTSVSGAVASIGSTGIVTGLTVGTSVISYNAAGCVATTTVNVLSPAAGLSFDGVDDYLNVKPGVYFNGDFTIEAWVYPRSFSVWARIIDFGNCAGCNNVLLSYTYGTSGQPGLYVEGAQFQATQTLPLNQWSHVAATLSGTTATIYVNGVAAGTATVPVPANVTRNNCYIGKSNWGDPYANAIMDEVRIWKVAKTPAQIQAGMNCDVAQNANLLAYYRFNEGTAAGTNTALTSAIDYSGNNNCAQLNNFALTGTASNYVTGAVGNCNTISIAAPAAFNSGTPTACVGTTTTLSNTVIGGQWFSSNTSVATVGIATGIVNGVSSGIANITYLLNCQTVVTTVTVNPRPTPTFISGPSATVCANVNTTYTTQSGGGITNYSWLVPGSAGIDYTITSGGIGSSSSSVTLMWLAPSSRTVTVNYSDINGCSGLLPATNTTSINPVPLAISGPTAMCPGTTTSVADASPGGTWSSAAPSLASIGSGTGIITGNAAGVTTISYTFTATGCYATSQLTINPLPGIITGASPLCQGGTETLADATTGGSWTSSAPSIASINAVTGFVNGVSAGSATMTYTLPTTCQVTDIVVVNPNPAAIAGTFSLCAGSGATLSDATASGTWTSSNTAVATIGSTTGIVAGLTAGTTTISYTLITGCMKTQAITVNPVPVVAAITGTATMCAGSTTGLSNTTPSGTWSSSNTLIATVTSTGLVTGAAAGTATITYSVTSAGCTAFVTQNVTVNPVPGAISGNAPICSAGSITLSAAGGGTWSSASTGVATIGTTSGIVTAVGPGTSTITYTLPAGCFTTATVTVNSLPVVAAIGGATSACAGQSATVTDATLSGTWSSSNISVATIGTAGSVAAVAAGTATITYTVTSGVGCTTFVTNIFTVNALPGAIAGTTVICTGSVTGLSDGTSGGTWSSGTTSTGTVTASTGVVTGIAPGTTVITYTLSTGCSANTTVTVNPIPSAITGTLSVCTGLTTTLASTPAGGTWISSNTGEATVSATGVVTGVAAGTPTITYSLGSTCYMTAQVTVNALPSAISGIASACAGAVSTLTNTGGGTWSSSSPSVASVGSSTGIVNASIAGTTTITYTLPTGCVTTTVFTVNPQPTAITGIAAVCVGNTTLLASTPAGGTWTSSNTGMASISGTGFVTGISVGMPSITYTLAAGCYVVTPVTVMALPSAILGTAVVCSGSTTTLSNFGGGTWSSSFPSIAAIGATTGVVTGGVAGTATITYTLSTGCTTTIIVTVNPLPAAITGTPAVCVGLTTTLGSTTGGGTWSSSNIGQASVTGSGVVTGISAGVPTITYALATGCIVTRPVTVNPLPATIAGASNVCTGATTTLTDITSGGTWSSSASGVAAIGATTGVVTGASAGTATITYTLSTGCIVTKAFTVNQTPTAITGTTSVCIGSATTLGSTPGGGTWSSSNTAQGSVSSTGVVSGISAGIPTIYYTLSTGCVAGTLVTVNTLPAAIAGVASVCTGNSTTLSSTTPGGAWTSGSPSVASVTSTGLVTGATPGTAVITYSLPTGCTASITVTVNQTPTALTGIAVMCQGATTTLSTTPGGGTWTSSNPAEATVVSTSGFVTGISAGTPTISYTMSTGCFNTATVTVNAMPAAITGLSSICTGFTTLLLDATTGGSWTSSSPSVASIGSSSGLVSGNIAGTTTITYALPTGCNVTQSFSVNGTPASITGAGAICPGATLTLSDATTGGTWTSSNTAEATIGSTTGTVTGVAAGTPTITYTLSSGCNITAQVTVNSAPNVSIFTAPTATSQCVGLASTVTINSISLGSAAYTFAYTLSGANSGTGSVLVTMASGSGTFTIPSTSLTSTGSTNVTLTSVTNGLSCATALTTSNVASFVVNALPTVFTVTGGGSYCAGGTGVHVLLSGSSTGVNYQLMLSGSAAGSPVAGTSSAIDFGLFTTGGSYSVIATNATTGCVSNMTGTATVTVNPLPVAATVTGGGGYCVGGSGLAVGLSASQAGVNYQLFNGTTAIGSAVAGTGSAISFGIQTAAGTYTVVATNPTTLCTNNMTGGVTITINPLPTAITGTLNACSTFTSGLGSTPSGGTWSTGSSSIAPIGSATGIVTGGIAGTATITYTLSTGCSVSAQFTTNAMPAAITGVTSVCFGNTTALGSTTTGGTWTSSNPAVGSISATGVVSGISAGTASVSYTLTTGCAVGTTVTVNSSAGTITGIPVICVGGTSALSDATTGGTWSSSNTAFVSIGSATGIATGVTAGTATITYSLTSGCLTTFPVTVIATAAITGTTVMCVGGSTTVFNTIGSGTWSSSNASIAAIGTAGVLSGLSAGVATITYTLPSGCLSVTNVTVNALPSAISGASSVCFGLTTPLTNATSGGTWSSSAPSIAGIGASTGIVSGAGAGTAIITYTIGGGCNAVFPMTVNAAPAAITGTVNVCVGSTTTLASTTTGGTWSSSNIGEATVSSTGVVTGVSAGNPTITYALGTGCIGTRLITVNALPLSITGTATVCSGSTTTLADASTGGTWSSSDVTIALIGTATGVITGNNAGIASISYTLATGCATGTTVTVNVSPAAISGSPVVCIGTASTLSNTTTGGTWTSSNTSLATIGSVSGIVNGVGAGNPVISYVMSGTGCFTTVVASVNASPSAISGASSVCIGGTTSLTDATFGGSWSSSNPTIASVTSTGIVTGGSSGTVTISYTMPAGCGVTTTITVNAPPTAITGPTSVCIGNTITLGSTPSGGTWTSSNTVLATVSVTGVVTGLSSGTPNITYALPTGCMAWLTVTVNPNPAAIAGTTTVCVNGIAALADATTGGTWTSSNIALASIGLTSGIITGVSAGTLTNTYTLPTGCLATISVTVNPLPTVYTVRGGGSYCAGGVGVHDSLSSSSTGISYQLYNGTSASGAPVAGTGAALDFGLRTSGGTYTVIATNATTGCSVTMAGSATITGLSLPAVFTVSGGGSYCSGSTGLHVLLSGSVSGIGYQLFNGTTPIASASGTGSSLDFGIFTASGTYTAVATNLSTSCTSNMTGSATISINPLPTIFSVSGGGFFCAGTTGVHIGLGGSSSGVNYQLFNGLTPGAILPGTGAALDFGLFITGGTYTIVATNPTTTCTTSMSGSTTVVSNPAPTAFTVTSTGSITYCAGGTGPVISLSGYTPGVTYQLFNGITPVTGPITGTGSTLSFGTMTAGGIYTAVATIPATGCTAPMTGSITVTVTSLPTVFSVTGGGSLCTGGPSVPIGLSSSQTGVSYQLFLGGALQSTVAGSGSALSFGSFSTAGTYTVVGTSGGCVSAMSGGATITVNPLPTVFTISGGGGYCAGAGGVSIGLGGSQSGVLYQLSLTGTGAIGAPVAGTGTVITFGVFTTAGIYTVAATNSGTGCTASMTGSATVAINPLPAAQTLTVGGGGTYCVGGIGDTVYLSGSQSGISYQLFVGGVPSGSPITGTGPGIIFGVRTSGTYTAVATNTVTGCTTTMTGSPAITPVSLPSVYYVTGGGSICSGTTGTAPVGLSGSQAGVSYQLYNGTALVTTVSGTGAAISFGVVTAAGTYTVVAVGACTSAMSGSAVVTVPSSPIVYNVTGGGNYCAGSAGVHVFLSGSSSAVTYALYLTGAPTGITLSGTGSPLDFGTFTTAGNYTVIATSTTTGCTATMSGAATISISSLPTAYTVTVTGGGVYCAGGTGLTVGLSGSATGVSYQLYNGFTPGVIVSGTGSAITFGTSTAAGAYTIVATSGSGCVNTMTGSVSISINPLPVAYNVTGGGSLCAGGSALSVDLDGSESGIEYSMLISGSPYYGPVTGTGFPISFGTYSTNGTYTVTASNPSTGCISTMAGSAVITVHPLPTAMAVTGGGAYCAGTAGMHVGLAGSVSGVSYQLYLGVTPNGSPVSGTGASIDFGLKTATGSYSVIATDGLTGCVATMTGTATVSVNALPAAYSVTGGGSFCSGGTGYHIGLSGSQSGISYQLLRGGTTLVGIPLSGTGASLDFGLFTTAGPYTVVATNTSTLCTRNMTGSVTITVSSLPIAYTVSGGGSFCPGGAGFHVYLSSSASGVSYQLYRSGTAAGSAFGGTGGTLDFGNQTLAGTYTVIATSGGGCTNTMTGSATITINALPSAYTLSGGGNYCTGGTGFHILLSGSDGGVDYQVYSGTSPVGSAISGTGGSLDFGLFTAAGTYTVVATNTSTLCTATMPGSVSITITALPTAYTVTGGGTSCASGTPFHVGLSGSAVGINYTLLLSGFGLSTVAGTGAAIDFGSFTSSGTYTVKGTNTSTGCLQLMTGSAVIGVSAALTLYTVSGGGTFCAGGAGYHIYLGGSTAGVNYQLYRGTVAVGSPLAGTGSSLDFGLQTTTGGYNVVATNATTGCTRSMSGSATITVNALPTAYTITGGGSYCAGGFGLSVGLSGSQSGISYQLYRAGTIAVGSSVAGSGAALDFGLQAAAGVYTVVATNSFTTCTSNMPGSVTITILSLPSAGTISGLTTVGTGASITLTESVTGGVWSASNTHVAIGSASGIVTGVSAGTVTISYAVTNTCGTVYATRSLTESGGAKSGFTGGTVQLCMGAAEKLSNKDPGGAWSSNDNNVATVDVQSGVVTGVSLGVTEVTYVYSDVSGGTTTTLVPIRIEPAADEVVIAAKPGTSIAAGQRLSLTAAVNNGATVLGYQWLINGVVVKDANTATFSSIGFSNNDIVTCNVTGECGNKQLAKSVKVTVVSEGVLVPVASGDMRVVPNPNNGIFTIKGSLGTIVNEEVTLEMTDVLGQVIYRTKVKTVAGEVNTTIHLGKTVPNGMYLLNMNAGSMHKVFHVVVEQ